MIRSVNQIPEKYLNRKDQERVFSSVPTNTVPSERQMTAKEPTRLMPQIEPEVDETNSEDIAQPTSGGVANQDRDLSIVMDANANQPEIMQELRSNSEREDGTLQEWDEPVQYTRLSGERKRKRGKTVARGSIVRIRVEFNERGQPIRSNSVAYSTYLGVVGREVTPISFKDWREVPQDLKERMWTMVKQNFIVPEYAKKISLMTIGKNWREYKARLRTSYYDIHDNDEDRIANCPEDVELEEWKIFVASISSPDYVEKREKMKEVRKHHKAPQTSSRKGFARLEDEMKCNNDDPSSITRAVVWTKGHIKKNGEPVNDFAKEKIEEIKETGSSYSYFKDDTLSQVLGPESRGRVRGMGLGVTPTKLSASEHNSVKVRQLEEEVKALRDKLSSMETMQEELTAMRALFVKFMECQQNQTLFCNEDRATMQRILSILEKQSGTQKYVKCKLIRLVPEDVVAHGYWYTDDPKDPAAVVHGQPIGPGMSKVFITEAVQDDALLVKKTDKMGTVGDAVARFVVWPTSSVIKEEVI